MRDATLNIARGEIVGMFGPSGSGKSTLLTAMALINPPTSGQISHRRHSRCMDGPRALVDLRAFRRQHLGFVFQKANLIPFLTALENVQIALEVNDTPREQGAQARAMELLDYLGVGRAPTISPTPSPAANNSASPSPAPWPTTPASSSPTNPPPRSTARSAGRSWNSSPRSPTSATPASSSSPTTTARSMSSTASSMSRMGRSASAEIPTCRWYHERRFQKSSARHFRSCLHDPL